MVMRDVDLDFRTVFLVREESPARAIEAFEGRRFAFGSEDSTSGHLMPRHFLRERGIRPEAFFSTVRYSGAHDTSALWVQQGVVDLSAANGLVVEAMRAQSRLDGVRVLWESPGYPDYVWAAQGALAEPLRERIVAAFLELSPGDPEQRAILESVGAGGFVPARLSDFRSLSQIAAELGFL
jgi:phosphonate transport system substrate-binding protein